MTDVEEIVLSSNPKAQFPRCANCHRLIKSPRAFRFEGKLYGSICIQIRRGLLASKRAPKVQGNAGQVELGGLL